jgi:hypothetical protein
MGSRGEALMNDLPKGRPLAIDATARSASPTEPAFIARPDGAPVYYGFVVLDDINVDGFTLGKITDFPRRGFLGLGHSRVTLSKTVI